ncbi:hypothetical protein [Arthrobacter polaris]|uniref:hypothetical protein n=1 Tax=Arthrobacter polaris TaxID=2813727 RepID=UPI001F32097C|nr:hypothetical protein [Arthrobacter polaris]UIK88091.1 hypothetical protein J0916_11625 [Arthrobacter polaris]
MSERAQRIGAVNVPVAFTKFMSGVLLRQPWAGKFRVTGFNRADQHVRASHSQGIAVFQPLRRYCTVGICWRSFESAHGVVCRQCGIGHNSHPTAMNFLHAGVEITVISLWLGHEQTSTTDVYLKHSDIATKMSH